MPGEKSAPRGKKETGRPSAAATALRRALRLLAVRGRSCAEMGERLQQAGFSAETVSEAMEKLQRAGLLDDRRFAFDRARALAERGYGPRRIGFELARRGISAELSRQAIEQAYGEEGRPERLRRLLRQRFGEDFPQGADLKKKARAQRFLLSRGFEQDEIAALLRFCC